MGVSMYAARRNNKENIINHSRVYALHQDSPIDVTEDLLEHGRLIQNNNLVVVVAMSTGVDDAVHVEIKVVDLAIDVEAIVDPLVDVGILVSQPTEHFGDAMKGRNGIRCRDWREGRGRIRTGICRRPKWRILRRRGSCWI